MKLTIALIAALTATTATAEDWKLFSEPGTWPEIRIAIEGNRLWISEKQKDSVSETDYGDADCGARTLKGPSGWPMAYKDMPPGSLGRQAIDYICGEPQ